MTKLNLVIANLIALNDALGSPDDNITNATAQCVAAAEEIGEAYEHTANDGSTMDEVTADVKYLSETKSLFPSANAQTAMKAAYTALVSYTTTIPVS